MHYSSGYLGYRREVDPDLPIHDRQLSPHLFDDTEGRYLTAAEAGDVIAMVRLGSLLRHLGRDAEALPWLRRAAQAGDTTGMLALAELVGQLWTAEVIAHWPSPGDPIRLRRTYVTQVNPYEQELPGEAGDWLRRSADSGNTDAMMILGRQAQHARHYERAHAWFRRAADAGSTAGMVWLARVLPRVRDSAACVQEQGGWLRRAADRGDLHGILDLIGWLSKHAPEDRDEIRHWLVAAAGLHDADSMVKLGDLARAQGQVADAERWYRQAVDEQDLDGMEKLGYLLVDQDRRDELEELRRRGLEIAEVLIAVCDDVTLNLLCELQDQIRGWWAPAG